MKKQSKKEPLFRRTPPEFVRAWETKYLEGQELKTLEEVFNKKVGLEDKLQFLGKFYYGIYFIAVVLLGYYFSLTRWVPAIGAMPESKLTSVYLLLSLLTPLFIPIFILELLRWKIGRLEDAIGDLLTPLYNFQGCVVGIIDPKTDPQYVEMEHAMKRLVEFASLLVRAEKETQTVRQDLGARSDMLSKICDIETTARSNYKAYYAKLAQVRGYYNLPSEVEILSQARAGLAT